MAYMEFLKSARGRLVDDLLILKAKGTVGGSSVGENPIGTAKTYDTGGGRTRGDVVTQVYAMTATVMTSTSFKFRLQGGKNSSFSTYVDLQILELGANETLSGGVDLEEGRYVLPFTNDFDGTVYRYLRHYLTVAGTAGFGVQYEVFLSKIQS